MPATYTDSIDGLTTSVAEKAPVVVATSGAITLSGEQTVNSVACVEGDRVLVKDQDDSTTNGIYVCSDGAWSRALDFNGNRDVVKGTSVRVAGPSVSTGSLYIVTTENPIVIGTSAIVFVQKPEGAGESVDFISLEDLRASSTDQNYVTVLAANEGGSTGRMELYNNGTTGTPTTNGNRFSDLAAGTFFNAAGIGYSLVLDQTISFYTFGAVGDGSTDDATAMQLAFDSGRPLYGYNGTFLANSTITLPTQIFLHGQSARGCVIKSGVVAGSLFDTDPAGVSFMWLKNFTCEGNNLTGASGNGHCFNFIDPAISSGSNTPQVSVLENIYIRRFRGTDDADNGGVTKVASAGVIAYDALALTCRRVFVQTCGHGFYFRQTQNCRITDCLVEGMQKAGVFSYANQNLVIENSDLIECGDGSTDSGYPVADAGMGIVVSYEDDGISLTGSKLKSHYGDACIVAKGNTQNFTIERCWIRGTAIGNVQYRGIYAERIAGLVVRNNLFFPTAGDYAGSQTYRAIELYNPSVAPSCDATIEDNVFMDGSGLTTEYNVGITGNGTTRLHNTVVRQNRFGSNASVSAATTVTRDIYISNCLLDSSYIGMNSHYAPTNVTRTACVEYASGVVTKTTIAPSNFVTGGGSITANYVGVAESVSTSTDYGDAAATLSSLTESTAVWNTPLTANRSVSLSTTGASSGLRKRVVRTAAATGAFNLNVGSGPLKALAAGQWCEVEYNGSAWALMAFGSL
jgi:hypothetical protein